MKEVYPSSHPLGIHSTRRRIDSMTANELLRNSTIRRAHYIEMFKNNDVRRILLLLNAVDSDLQKQIFARAGKSYNMTSKRLELMQRDVKESVALGQQILSKSMNETALEFSKEEINWTVNTLTKAVPSAVAPQFVYPSATQVLSAIKATPYSNTTMQQFIKGWADNKLHRFNNALKLGFIQGQGVEDIARKLFGTRALQYTDGLANMSRREIRTGVRTAINHFSQTAREETYKANEEFVKGIQWVSTLDARTTLICIGLDGKIDLLDESVMELNGQRPPAHFNCRSTTVPVLKSLKELGLSEREFSTSTRASMNGQVSAKETYSTWFAKQDDKFQKSVLGKGRYELYKSGQVQLDKFADNGRTMTLAQLGKLKIDMPEKTFEKPFWGDSTENSQEVLDRLRTKFNVISVKNLDGGATVSDIKFANHVGQSLEEIYTALPDLQKIAMSKEGASRINLNITSESGSKFGFGENTFGCYEYGKTNSLPTINIFGKARARENPMLNLYGRSHNVAADFNSIFRHEYGHHVQESLLTQAQNKIIEDTFKKVGGIKIRRDISLYAETSAKEMFAEVFSAYTSPVHGQYNQTIPKWAQKMMDEVLGTRS